ncbi:hypothetical protein [Microbacterium pygmaeum]|uniref:Uncharacterized protein n=1 Tax=Microbacterium pygmaeum TaxID=370764 RepID=A0A1G7UJM9_9MICO|nr:hypothetical protein [Microbacterium pygmaeum]SDG46950.1 hypothetical protein SAMN04489810_0386 [Microbacterium pygmaeum]
MTDAAVPAPGAGGAPGAGDASGGGASARAKARRDVPVGVVMIGISIAAWWPAFTLGAWGELFFDQILTLWAASTAAFVFVLVERRPVGPRLVRAFLLLMPTLWLALNFAVDDDTQDLATAIVDLVAIVAVLIGLLFTVFVLVRIMWPDLGSEIPRRTRWLVVLVVAGITVASFLLGVNNARFMTCQDFEISGNSRPPTCRNAPSDAAAAPEAGAAALSRHEIR